VDDYGCGGSDVTALPWKAKTWYEYRVERAARRGPKLWNWIGAIYEKGTALPIYIYMIFGGEYITYTTTWAELINVRCTDPKLVTHWANPWLGNDSGEFRVGRISLSYGGDACLRSRQVISNECQAHWIQHQGANRPVSPATADELRTSHSDDLEERYCEREADATEKAIAKAYVQAISGGSGRTRVSGAIDFRVLGCTAGAVWEEEKCQKRVFNGKDGKTVLMEAISAATAGNWETSNIKTLIPEDAMRRIMHDVSYAQAKALFDNMSNPNNGWYSYLEGPGQAKAVLRQYMNAMQ